MAEFEFFRSRALLPGNRAACFSAAFDSRCQHSGICSAIEYHGAHVEVRGIPPSRQKKG